MLYTLETVRLQNSGTSEDARVESISSSITHEKSLKMDNMTSGCISNANKPPKVDVTTSVAYKNKVVVISISKIANQTDRQKNSSVSEKGREGTRKSTPNSSIVKSIPVLERGKTQVPYVFMEQKPNKVIMIKKAGGGGYLALRPEQGIVGAKPCLIALKTKADSVKLETSKTTHTSMMSSNSKNIAQTNVQLKTRNDELSPEKISKLLPITEV